MTGGRRLYHSKNSINGEEAYQYLKENEVDLILADIKMPVMTGLELLEKYEQKSVRMHILHLTVIMSLHLPKAIQYNCMEYILSRLRKISAQLVRKAVKKKELIVIEKEKQQTFQKVI